MKNRILKITYTLSFSLLDYAGIYWRENCRYAILRSLFRAEPKILSVKNINQQKIDAEVDFFCCLLRTDWKQSGD
ncbi:hypothetical protein A2303_01100 [Candidatus Falkowbacteria bacterium RIFOXYB2_FULL_47_14]|uniref:Uncharacterized protein n=1 Tax=Candidatus Falkowbacteria bacterium RIFOXYA2_FULL_47_19 TaxID=1797994 RepID=A0A1F5SFY7_9BACT|nr:MAG: hypothetical protein A2227_00300 [Candidatus Falkowbacteria bacterium RIFOXYA2_FULL_47_19]OGF35556.1 MAG: hypothetical protein A2468_05975 [Candidatus Falkowbacteria bacterium RIFOXYC2_FULL_46_15]OGF42961.1 MAG: hypothetical protein A2303_01100 [Candidatus Falkowbacteria bacterium RIFOXYB2_FULL_47_14]